MLPDFSEVMDTLLALDNQFSGMSWEPTSNGTVEIVLYVGVQNTDLLKQGRIMFADRD